MSFAIPFPHAFVGASCPCLNVWSMENNVRHGHRQRSIQEKRA